MAKGNRQRVKILPEIENMDRAGDIVRHDARRQNAITHALSASAANVPDRDRHELQQLTEAARQQFKPDGEVEDAIVQLIAHHLCRQFRACRLEAAQLERAYLRHKLHPNHDVNQELAGLVPSPPSDALLAELVVPTPNIAELIQRTETHASRMVDRLVAQLRQMQRRRSRRRSSGKTIRVQVAAVVATPKNRKTNPPTIKVLPALPGPAAEPKL